MTEGNGIEKKKSETDLFVTSLAVGFKYKIETLMIVVTSLFLGDHRTVNWL